MKRQGEDSGPTASGNCCPPSHSERIGKQDTWQKASRLFIYSSGKQRQEPPCIEWEYGSPSLSQGFTLDDYLTKWQKVVVRLSLNWRSLVPKSSFVCP